MSSIHNMSNENKSGNINENNTNNENNINDNNCETNNCESNRNSIGRNTDERRVVTDGQDLAGTAAQLKAAGITDVTVVVNTFNYTRYKESNDGKELQPVIDGINAAVGQGLKVRLEVALKEGFNDDEILDFLQLTLLHRYDIVFLPTIDYEIIKKKMPLLRKVEGDFGDVDMYKYAIAKGRIGFKKQEN